VALALSTRLRHPFKLCLYIGILDRVMSKAELDIKKWGNSLGVRLPAAIARAARLHEHQRVRVEVKRGQVLITPIEDTPLSLEQRLALFDPARHGGEAMVTEPVGAERW
jgi:antitoxin MazE